MQVAWAIDRDRSSMQAELADLDAVAPLVARVVAVN